MNPPHQLGRIDLQPRKIDHCLHLYDTPQRLRPTDSDDLPSNVRRGSNGPLDCGLPPLLSRSLVSHQGGGIRREVELDLAGGELGRDESAGLPSDEGEGSGVGEFLEENVAAREGRVAAELDFLFG